MIKVIVILIGFIRLVSCPRSIVHITFILASYSVIYIMEVYIFDSGKIGFRALSVTLRWWLLPPPLRIIHAEWFYDTSKADSYLFFPIVVLIPGAGRRNVLIARPASVVESIRFNVPFVPHIPYIKQEYSFTTWNIPILLTVVIVKSPAFSVINVKHDVLVSSVKVAEVESSTPKIVPKLPMKFLAGVYNSEAEICVAGFAMKRYLPTLKTIVYTDCKWICSP